MKFRLTNEIQLLKDENERLIKNNLSLKHLVKSQKDLLLEEEHIFEVRFKKLLSDIFTPTQINLILHPLKKVYKWQPNDIASAISLRSISPRAYTFLRETKKFPLPGYKSFTYNKHCYNYKFNHIGLSTLRQWASTFELNPGILYNVLHLMKAKGKHF